MRNFLGRMAFLLLSIFFVTSCNTEEDEFEIVSEIREDTVSMEYTSLSYDSSSEINGVSIQVQFTIAGTPDNLKYGISPRATGYPSASAPPTILNGTYTDEIFVSIDYGEDFYLYITSDNGISYTESFSIDWDTISDEIDTDSETDADTDTDYTVTVSDFIQKSFDEDSGVFSGSILFEDSTAEDAVCVEVEVYKEGDFIDNATTNFVGTDGTATFEIEDDEITDESELTILLKNCDDDETFLFSYGSDSGTSISDTITVDSSLVNAVMLSSTITTYANNASIAASISAEDISGDVTVIITEDSTGDEVFSETYDISGDTFSISDDVEDLDSATDYQVFYYTNYDEDETNQAFYYQSFTTKNGIDMTIADTDIGNNYAIFSISYTSDFEDDQSVIFRLEDSSENIITTPPSQTVDIDPVDTITSFDVEFENLGEYSGESITFYAVDASDDSIIYASTSVTLEDQSLDISMELDDNSLTEDGFSINVTGSNSYLETQEGTFKIRLVSTGLELQNTQTEDFDTGDDNVQKTLSWSGLSDYKGQIISITSSWENHDDVTVLVALPNPSISVEDLDISNETIQSALVEMTIDNPTITVISASEIYVEIYDSSNNYIDTYISTSGIDANSTGSSINIELGDLKDYHGQTLSIRIFVDGEEFVFTNDTFTLESIQVSGGLSISNVSEDGATARYTFSNNNDAAESGLIIYSNATGTTVVDEINFAASSKIISPIEEDNYNLSIFGMDEITAQLVWDVDGDSSYDSEIDEVLDTAESFTLIGNEISVSLASYSGITTDDVTISLLYNNSYTSNKAVTLQLIEDSSSDIFYTTDITLSSNTSLGSSSQTISNQLGYAGSEITAQVVFDESVIATGTFSYSDPTVTSSTLTRSYSRFLNNNTTGTNMLDLSVTTDASMEFETMYIYMKPENTGTDYVQIDDITSNVRIVMGTISMWAPPLSSTSWVYQSTTGYYRLTVDLSDSEMESENSTDTNRFDIYFTTSDYTSLGLESNTFSTYVEIVADGDTYGTSTDVETITTY